MGPRVVAGLFRRLRLGVFSPSRVWRRFVRGSREISPAQSLHIILTLYKGKTYKCYRRNSVAIVLFYLTFLNSALII